MPDAIARETRAMPRGARPPLAAVVGAVAVIMMIAIVVAPWLSVSSAGSSYLCFTRAAGVASAVSFNGFQSLSSSTYLVPLIVTSVWPFGRRKA